MALRPADIAEVDDLKAELAKLRTRVVSLEHEVETLRGSSVGQEVIVLRTVERDQAKREIGELFQTGETLYYSDIATRLRIELPVVVELCQELQDEGEIEIDAHTIQ